MHTRPSSPLRYIWIAALSIAADFDDDGDRDIAAIAFFADLEDESAKDFVYLEQTGPLAFTPHAPPLQYAGRRLTMDAGDYDADADVDLMLSNYAARGYIYIREVRRPIQVRRPIRLLIFPLSFWRTSRADCTPGL